MLESSDQTYDINDAEPKLEVIDAEPRILFSEKNEPELRL